MIPMGTVVAFCMLLSAVFANRFPSGALNQITPLWLLRSIGSITGAAGLWNVFWYGLRHIGEFWGHMALGSGLVMCALSLLLVLSPGSQPSLLNKFRPLLVVAMLLFCAYYGWTIYQL
jgi:hypothetical protein